MTLLLIRHASAGDADQWQGDDRVRPLDSKGIRQAEAHRPASGRVRPRTHHLEPLSALRPDGRAARPLTWAGDRGRRRARRRPPRRRRVRPRAVARARCGRVHPRRPALAREPALQERIGLGARRSGRAGRLPAAAGLRRLRPRPVRAARGPHPRAGRRARRPAERRACVAPPPARLRLLRASPRARARGHSPARARATSVAPRASWPVARALALSVRPTRRRSARAVPPVASAARGSGGASPEKQRSTSASAAATSSGRGGSCAKQRWASRREPMSRDLNHTGPSSGVPKTICVEPPPTSQTAMLAGGEGRAATAPANANRPSSSALRAWTWAPVAAARAATSCSPFSACLPGAATSTS